MEEKLRSLFYDTFSGLATAKELAKEANTTQKVAQAFITKQASVQQFRKVNRKSFFIPITAQPGAYQVDLMFVKRQPVLVAIEITSRKVYAAVLKDKTGSTASTEMDEIIRKIKSNGDLIDTVESDSGGEFLSKFDAVLKSHGIRHLVYPKTDNKNTSLAKVERVNQTLRGYYEKLKSTIGAPSLNEAMYKVTSRYNARVHSSTDTAPNQFKPEDFAPQFNREAVRGLPARDSPTRRSKSETRCESPATMTCLRRDPRRSSARSSSQFTARTGSVTSSNRQRESWNTQRPGLRSLGAHGRCCRPNKSNTAHRLIPSPNRTRRKSLSLRSPRNPSRNVHPNPRPDLTKSSSLYASPANLRNPS